MGLGQSFGKDWIHVVAGEDGGISDEDDGLLRPWWDYTEHKFLEMQARAPEHAQHMNEAHSVAERYGQVCIMQTRLP